VPKAMPLNFDDVLIRLVFLDATAEEVTPYKLF